MLLFYLNLETARQVKTGLRKAVAITHIVVLVVVRGRDFKPLVGVGTQNRAIFRTSALMYIAMRMARVSLVFVPTGNAGSTPQTHHATDRAPVGAVQTGGDCWPSCMQQQHTVARHWTITTNKSCWGVQGSLDSPATHN